MWRELIRHLDPTTNFFPGADTHHIADVEASLGIALPTDLMELLRESDGILREDGQHLIWSVEEIKRENLALRTEPEFINTYMPLDCLLFFADAGVDSIRFGFAIVYGKIKEPQAIYSWQPMDDSRQWAAPSLARYLEWWLTGKLAV